MLQVTLLPRLSDEALSPRHTSHHGPSPDPSWENLTAFTPVAYLPMKRGMQNLLVVSWFTGISLRLSRNCTNEDNMV